jgi:hypothetical protein
VGELYEGGLVYLDNALADILNNVPDCVATGWVDIRSGMLLEVHTTGSPDDGRDLVTDATSQVFRGPMVTAIEDMFQRALSETTTDHYFREIVVMSNDLIHMFARCKRNTDHVLVVVTRISTNLGALITRTRAALAALDNAAA